MASAVVGISFDGLPAPVHITLALLAGAVAGGLWGFIPAYLRAKFGAHEVITTMMLSYVALYLTSYMVNYPFKAPGWVAHTIPVLESARLPRILSPTQLSASLYVVVLLVVLTEYVLRRTVLGFELRATGLNPDAAENAGINVNRSMILALVISGAIAGLGGSGEILGVHRRFIDNFSPGYGWDGLAVALVGGLNPVGAFLAAILFGALRSGGMAMTRATGVPLDIVFLLQALVILFVAAPKMIRTLLKRSGLRWLGS
jgi:simple sugar transport system permease protein